MVSRRRPGSYLFDEPLQRQERGSGATNHKGVRLGKGAGYSDIKVAPTSSATEPVLLRIRASRKTLPRHRPCCSS